MVNLFVTRGGERFDCVIQAVVFDEDIIGIEVVEIAKIGIFASAASGCRNDASTPVILNGNGPSSFSASHPRSRCGGWR